MIPILAIGALGGSGTRAYAKVLQQAGIFIGDDLNESLDNLLFSRLFKDPEWYDGVSHRGIRRRIQIFTKLMQAEGLSTFESLVFRNALKSNATYKTSKDELKALTLKSHTNNSKILPKAWGWKEPNTHLVASEFLTELPSLQYVHVLRNGLDMAFSENKRQLLNWGNLFGIQVSGNETCTELAVKQLDFWIASTRKIQQIAQQFPERVHFFSLTDFCENPGNEITRLLNLIGYQLDETVLSDLSTIPEFPKSHHRFKSQDTSIFRPDQLDFVQEMGFEV